MAPPDFSDSRRFRQSFGLDDSDEAIAYAAAINPGGTRFGVPLTPDELADMEARSRRQEQQGPLSQLVSELSDDLGAMWVDQRQGGQYVVMALPSLSDADRQRLVESVPPGGSVRFQSATVSWSTLRAWVDRLAQSLMTKSAPTALTAVLEDMGLRVTSIRPAVQSNSIIVFFATTPSDEPRLTAAWDRAVEAGDAPPRSYTSFEVGEPLRALTGTPPSTP